MLIVFEQVLLLMLFAAVGFALCKTGVADRQHTRGISFREQGNENAASQHSRSGG